MNHPFYDRSPAQQRAYRVRVIATLVGVLLGLAGVVFLLHAYWVGFLTLAVLLAALLLQLFAPFLDTPAGRAKGSLVYYAPLFIVEPRRDGDKVLHGGTLFDYWFVLRGPLSAEQRKRRVLLDYVRGLIALAREHERSGGPSFDLWATSYVLGPVTARRAGFEVMPLRAGALLVWFNALQLTAAYSLVHRRVRLPPLHRTRSYRATIESLVEHVPHLQALEARLTRAVSGSAPPQQQQNARP